MFTVILINICMVALVVGIHYECLNFLSWLLNHIHIKRRMKIVVGVFGSLIAHAIEIGTYAVVYYFIHHLGTWGHLQGNFIGTFEDCIYFSYTSYTTIGFGDIVAIGRLRFISSIESLTGVVLISWTASFLYLEMKRHWDLKE